jgi:hypothetical protein
VRGTTATSDDPTGNFGSALEDILIGDFRSVSVFAENPLQVIFGVLQHNLPTTEVASLIRWQLIQRRRFRRQKWSTTP